jgi:hypothetical protein
MSDSVKDDLQLLEGPDDDDDSVIILSDNEVDRLLKEDVGHDGQGDQGDLVRVASVGRGSCGGHEEAEDEEEEDLLEIHLRDEDRLEEDDEDGGQYGQEGQESFNGQSCLKGQDCRREGHSGQSCSPHQ